MLGKFYNVLKNISILYSKMVSEQLNCTNCALFSLIFLMSEALCSHLFAVFLTVEYDVNGLLQQVMDNSLNQYYLDSAQIHKESIKFWDDLQNEVKMLQMHLKMHI